MIWPESESLVVCCINMFGVIPIKGDYNFWHLHLLVAVNGTRCMLHLLSVIKQLSGWWTSLEVVQCCQWIWQQARFHQNAAITKCFQKTANMCRHKSYSTPAYCVPALQYRVPEYPRHPGYCLCSVDVVIPTLSKHTQSLNMNNQLCIFRHHADVSISSQETFHDI